MSAIVSSITDQERAIWKNLYMLYEEYHDSKWTDSDWLAYAKKIGILYEESGRSELMCQMLIGLSEYFSGVSKAMQKAPDIHAEQLSMEV